MAPPQHKIWGLFEITAPRVKAASVRKSAKETQEDNNLRFAFGLIATGIPFRVVENPHFQAMFDYELPSRRQISGRLLDKLYEREKTR
ncbi:hypothetical protein L917_03410, partial [Phytophthora nicotianae]